MKCEEVDGLDLKDGAVRIFFNTRGKNSEEVSQDLVELLDFMENTTEQAGARSKNEKSAEYRNRYIALSPVRKWGYGICRNGKRRQWNGRKNGR